MSPSPRPRTQPSHSQGSMADTAAGDSRCLAITRHVDRVDRVMRTSYRSPKDKLLVSLRRGHAERVLAMLGHHGGELHPNMSADSADNRLLHRAARFGHAGVVRALVGRGGDVKARIFVKKIFRKYYPPLTNNYLRHYNYFLPVRG